VITAVARLDAFVARTRPLWRWLGQAALVILGVHLAADHLDDHVATAFAALPLPWPDSGTPRQAATWVAVAAELLTAGWAVWALARTAAIEPVRHPREWLQRRSIHAVVAPLAWVPLAAAGCWVVAMAAEDLVAGWWSPAAAPVAWGLAALVGWRLAGSGLVELVRRTPPPASGKEGWASALVVLPMAALAVRHGLPLWGWLP